MFGAMGTVVPPSVRFGCVWPLRRVAPQVLLTRVCGFSLTGHRIYRGDTPNRFPEGQRFWPPDTGAAYSISQRRLHRTKRLRTRGAEKYAR